MANTYHQVYLQFVFAVKYRDAVISKSWRSDLFSAIGNLINEVGCKTIIVNGVEDHVHCLVSMKPAITISELMKVVKARSSKFVNDNGFTQGRFEWQRGYGVFSYSQKDVGRVFRYIQNQEKHHQKIDFEREYTKMLKDSKIEFDPHYLFEKLL